MGTLGIPPGFAPLRRFLRLSRASLARPRCATLSGRGQKRPLSARNCLSTPLSLALARPRRCLPQSSGLRAEQARQDARAPQVEWKIVERIVKITHEAQVQEVVIYEHDEWRDRRRKLRALRLAPLTAAVPAKG